MKIAIGADHRGYALKRELMESNADIQWIDVGTHSEERVDFPAFAADVAKQVQSGQVERGVLLCGSGIGMSIAANRFNGVFAALVWNVEIAKLAREHDNTNILIIPADFVSSEQIQLIFDVWKKTNFLGGRYQERLTMIDMLA